jgi:hypothetical protein
VQAVPSELKIQQEFKDLLMENTEKVLLSVHQVPGDTAIFFRETNESGKPIENIHQHLPWKYELGRGSLKNPTL